MRKMTEAWLEASQDDLSAANQLLQLPELTNLVAFHSQQCIEKVLKAILEDLDMPNIKTHDVVRIWVCYLQVNQRQMKRNPLLT